MSDTKLGKPISDAGNRDAIHIAIAPVVSKETLYPGQHVGLVTSDEASAASTPVGIVDPFLRSPVFPGTRFYLCLYPQTVTSLRHEWTHPAFTGPETVMPRPNKTEESEKWLRDFADRIDITYNSLMRAAELWIESGEYTVQHGGQSWQNGFHDNGQDFWKHYAAVTGKTGEGQPFSCSC